MVWQRQPPQCPTTLERSLPNVSRTTLPGLGHLGPLEAPRRVVEAMEADAAAADERPEPRASRAA